MKEHKQIEFITIDEFIYMPQLEDLTEDDYLEKLFYYFKYLYDINDTQKAVEFFILLEKALTKNTPLQHKINLDGTIYHLIDFNEMTTGEYIDLDYYFKDIKTSKEFISILYRELDEEGNITPYTGSKPELFSNFELSNYKSLLDSYLKWKIEFVNKFSYLFSQDDEDEEEDDSEIKFVSDEQQFAEEFNWYPMLFIAAKEDFLKIDEVVRKPVSEFLYFVNFFKRKQQLDNNRIRNKKNHTII